MNQQRQREGASSGRVSGPVVNGCLLENLGRKQQDALLALLSSRNVEEAASNSHVKVRTLYRWLTEPAFKAAYREAKRASHSQASARVQQMTGAAASTLGKVMVDPATPAATKVRAAEIILNLSAKAIELEDIEARVEALESAAEAAKKD